MAETRANTDTMERFHLVYLAAADYLLGNHAEAERQCAKARGLMATVGGWHAAALCKIGEDARASARLSEYVAEVGALWQGAVPPDEQAVRSWFVSVFPLRDNEARCDLERTLARIGRQDCGPPA